MDRMLYVAMSGASQALLAQTVNNNNLANVNTTGFRSDLIAMEQYYVKGGEFPTRVYPIVEEKTADFKEGTMQSTQRELDIALDGDGWIAVQTPDGKEAYTRAGNLQISDTGQLLTGEGYPVMGNGSPISIPPAEKVSVGVDGSISIQGLGQAAQNMNQVDTIKLVKINHAQLLKRPDGLFAKKDGGKAEVDPDVRIVSGFLEGSNVNPVAALVDGIAISRFYEMQVKMMKAADDNAAYLSQLAQDVAG